MYLINCSGHGNSEEQVSTEEDSGNIGATDTSGSDEEGQQLIDPFDQYFARAAVLLIRNLSNINPGGTGSQYKLDILNAQRAVNR